MERRVVTEMLDELPASDPRALRSRRDLRRINWFMGNVRCLAAQIAPLHNGEPPRLAELGGGDGTVLLKVAQRLKSCLPRVIATSIDRAPVTHPGLIPEFVRLGWQVSVEKADARDWLSRQAPGSWDLIITNLFLHHFEDKELRELLARIAQVARAFVAVEPRRSPLAFLLSHATLLLGCNAVTRHDAVASVRAGFTGRELTRAWPGGNWELQERAWGSCSHLFAAQRRREE